MSLRTPSAHVAMDAHRANRERRQRLLEAREKRLSTPDILGLLAVLLLVVAAALPFGRG